MALPDFLIIGAQKSGTTWLADQLGRHPDVYVAPEEIHFFDKSHNFAKGREWYEKHFEAGQGKLLGEKTPDYLWTGSAGAEGHVADAHKRLHGMLPHARLLVVLRNPVDRAVSALTHLIRTRRVSPSHSIDDLLAGAKTGLIADHGVIEKGFYFRQLTAYANLFSSEQILVLVFEDDIADNPVDGLRKACEFLQVRPASPQRSSERERNASRRSRIRLLADYYVPPLRPFTRLLDRFGPPWRPVLRRSTLDQLYALYEEENERLFAWLERPMPSQWEHPYRAVKRVGSPNVVTKHPAPADPQVILSRRQRSPSQGA